MLETSECMYTYAYDKSAGMMVGVLARPFNDDLDNQRILESIAKQQVDAKNPSAGSAFILIVDPQYPHPNAKWRRRFAEARDKVRFAKSLFAVVTPETSLRAVLTAINWMRPPSPRFEAEAFATFDEAARWMEERSGKSRRGLTMLMDEAHEKLGYPNSSAASSRSKLYV